MIRNLITFLFACQWLAFSASAAIAGTYTFPEATIIVDPTGAFTGFTVSYDVLASTQTATNGFFGPSSGGAGYSFIGDTSLKIYRGGTGLMVFGSGGTDRMAITQNGNLVVGTTTDNSTGNLIQVHRSGGNAGMDFTALGGDMGINARIAAGTDANPTNTINGAVARALLAQVTTNQAASWVTVGGFEISIAGNSTTVNTGANADIYFTPSSTVGRVKGVQLLASDSAFHVLVGDVKIDTAGKGLTVKYGTNCKLGTFTLASGAAVVPNTTITANSVIFLTLTSPSGTLGTMAYANTLTNGASFNVTAGALDNSTYKYFIVEAQ